MKFIVPAFFLVLCWSCGSDTEKSKTDENDTATYKVESILVDDTEFEFQQDSIALILEKVGLCKTIDSLVTDSMPPCDYKLFRYFANQQEPVQNGFLVEIKPKVWSPFFLVVNIAKNQQGDYYKSNAYHGQLLEMRTTKDGPYELIIRYIDADVGTIAVLHKWNKTKYDPVEVLEINDHFVKPDKKDSLNDVYLKNFVWGF